MNTKNANKPEPEPVKFNPALDIAKECEERGISVMDVVEESGVVDYTTFWRWKTEPPRIFTKLQKLYEAIETVDQRKNK